MAAEPQVGGNGGAVFLGMGGNSTIPIFLNTAGQCSKAKKNGNVAPILHVSSWLGIFDQDAPQADLGAALDQAGEVVEYNCTTSVSTAQLFYEKPCAANNCPANLLPCYDSPPDNITITLNASEYGFGGWIFYAVTSNCAEGGTMGYENDPNQAHGQGITASVESRSGAPPYTFAPAVTPVSFGTPGGEGFGDGGIGDSFSALLNANPPADPAGLVLYSLTLTDANGNIYYGPSPTIRSPKAAVSDNQGRN